MADACDEHGEIRVRPDGMSWRRVGDDVIILDLERSRYVNLNGSAALLWEKLAVGAPLSELVAELVAAFDVEPEQARGDTITLLTDLRELGLLES